MEENKELQTASSQEAEILEATEAVATASVEDTETPLDKNVRLMSHTRMLFRRFFR